MSDSQDILSPRDRYSIISALTMGTLKEAYPEAIPEEVLTEGNNKALKEVTEMVLTGQMAEMIFRGDVFLCYDEDGGLNFITATPEEKAGFLKLVSNLVDKEVQS